MATFRATLCVSTSDKAVRERQRIYGPRETTYGEAQRGYDRAKDDDRSTAETID